MAVLKDLIVHGASRFINGIDADSIHANLIDAHDGIFKTITTTTLDAETITTDMLKANNARVSQTLTVDGTISTNKWEAANIANIGGNFYISPTGKADSGTITVTKTGSTTINGVSVGTYTIVVGSASFGVTSTSSTIWGASSKVIFTGSISYNSSKKYPLGTCNGTMTAVSIGTNTLTGFTITGVNSPALDIFFKEQGVTSVSNTACTGYEMQISVYQSYYSSALHPIGILLTSYGKDKKQYIDIYGGANMLGDSASGFANPSVRIGQLDGLPNIVDGSTDSATAPSGWGIYTDNGFFKGKIVANAGKIGNFTISNDLYTGLQGAIGQDTNVYVSPGISSTRSIAGSSGTKIWAFTAGPNFGVTTAGELFSTSGNIGGAEIVDGRLQVTEANITTISANKISVNKLSALTSHMGLLSAGRIQSGQPNQTGFMFMSPEDYATYVATEDTEYNSSKTYYTRSGDGTDASPYVYTQFTGTSFVSGTTYYEFPYQALAIGNSGFKTDWRLILGNSFGVDSSGSVYATGAKIQGDIEASIFKVVNGGITFMTADSNGIIIGQANGFHLEATATELGFFDNQSKVAYINDSSLFINKSVVVSQMDIGFPFGKIIPSTTSEEGKGQWSWKVHLNNEATPRNNLYLKWMG